MIAINNQPETRPVPSQGAVFRPARWMGRVLFAAAVYNLAWGSFAVFAPVTMLQWMGIETAPLYPEFWQCIGMIVGVYGVGYAIASRDPYRHWPIVLVGLLGKVFGPIGFMNAVIGGRLPVEMAWTIVTNDLIWWVPFAVILWHSARSHQSTGEQIVVPARRMLSDPLGQMMSQFGTSLDELSRRNPVLVVLLRHSGCTFCRESLGDIAEQRRQIEDQGVSIALVHMGQREPEELLNRYGLSDLPCFRDPMCHLYDYFGLQLGSFRQLLGLKVWVRGLQAALAGHGFGGLKGNGFRMPGAFLMFRGELLRSFRHDSAADRPDYVRLATLPQDADGATHVPAAEAI